MFEFSLTGQINFRGIQEQIAQICENPLSDDQKKEIWRTVLSLLDFTSLDGTDNPSKIESFCHKALSFKEHGFPGPAAVCIYPRFIRVAKKVLEGSGIRVATTAAAFPSGQLPLALKLNEVKFAVEAGADDVDIVISRGSFLQGAFDEVLYEIESMRNIASDCILKVILETGELKTYENIAQASELAIMAGADFIKTSTGKITPAATPEAVFIMLKMIALYHSKNRKKIGVKPAGGIANPESALLYYNLVKETLGTQWLSPALFRIGASRLADQVIGLLNCNIS